MSGARRVVLCARGDRSGAPQAARRLRDAGVEVVWLEEGYGPEALAATAVAEDADAVLVGDADLAAVSAALSALKIHDIVVEPLE